MPERVFVIRDEKMPPASPSEEPDPNKPTKELSINYVPVPYPRYLPGVISMKPSERQFWRVLNAAADTYLDLRVEFGGQWQKLGLISLDGVPLHYDQDRSGPYVPEQTHIFLPPAGRAEFILTGPPEGVTGTLMTNFVYRGAGDDSGTPIPWTKGTNQAIRMGQDDVDSTRPLAILIAAHDAPAPRSSLPRPSSTSARPGNAGLSSVRPVRTRVLYFSEKLTDPTNPKSTTLLPKKARPRSV